MITKKAKKRNKAVMMTDILHELKKLNAKNFKIRESSSSVSVRQFSLSVSFVAAEEIYMI